MYWTWAAHGSEFVVRVIRSTVKANGLRCNALDQHTLSASKSLVDKERETIVSALLGGKRL